MSSAQGTISQNTAFTVSNFTVPPPSLPYILIMGGNCTALYPAGYGIEGACTVTIAGGLYPLSIKPLQMQWSDLPGPPINGTGQAIYIDCKLPRNMPNVLLPDYKYTRTTVQLGGNSPTDGNTYAFVL